MRIIYILYYVYKFSEFTSKYLTVRFSHTNNEYKYNKWHQHTKDHLVLY